MQGLMNLPRHAFIFLQLIQASEEPLPFYLEACRTGLTRNSTTR